MIVRALLSAVLLWQGAAVAAQTGTTRGALIEWLDRQAADHLAKRAATVRTIRTRTQAIARQAEVRRIITDLIGLPPAHDHPLAVEVVRRVAGEGFAVEVLAFDGLPGQRITANLFLPTSAGRHPAVLLSPGHYLPGKLSNYAMVANLARSGIVALAYDLVGEGERMEYWDVATGRSRGERAGGDHSIAAFQAMATGDHIARTFVAEAIRGVDLLASRAEVDPQRIGAFGCSGGGTVTAYLTALDDRVAAAGVACYANTLATLLPAVGPQEAEQSIPDFVARGLDLPDWFELAAPRPYAIVSTTEDMFPYAGAQGAVDEMRGVWRAFGAEDRVEWITGPGAHGALDPLGDRIVDFFRRTLRAAGPRVAYAAAARPDLPERMLATPTGQLATSRRSVTYADIARDRLGRLSPRRALPLAELRAAIRRYARTQAVPGGGVDADAKGSTVTFASDAGSLVADVVPAAGASRVVLLLDPAPIAAQRDRIARLAKSGAAVLSLPVRGADGTEGIKSAIVGSQNLLALRALIVGRTLPGLRIDDAQRAVDWIAATYPGARIDVLGVGTAGPVALHLAALDDRVGEVTLKGSQLSWAAAVGRDIQRDLPDVSVPGALAAYDLPDLIRAVAPRRVRLLASIDPVGVPLSHADVVGLAPDATNMVISPYPDR